MIKSLVEYWKTFPIAIRKFLISSLILIIVWKCSYYLFLKPNRVLDKPLTSITTKATVWLYNSFTNDSLTYYGVLPSNNFSHYSEIVLKEGKKVLSIADPCNALELMVLYIGFLFCLYTNNKRVLAYIFLGLISIFSINVLRCIGMIWVSLNQKSWFHFAHHYLFTLVVYSFIFLLWVSYSKSFNKKER